MPMAEIEAERLYLHYDQSPGCDYPGSARQCYGGVLKDYSSCFTCYAFAAEGSCMETDNSKAIVQYAGDEFFVGISPSGHAVTVDTKQGRSTAPTPIELLMISLGSCTAVDVISILEKKRENVESYRVEVRGERRDEHPRSFKRLELRHIVSGKNISPKSVAQAIELSESKYCSVAATLRPTAEIVSTFEIIEV